MSDSNTSRLAGLPIELGRLVATTAGLPVILMWLSHLQESLLVRWYPPQFSTVPLVELGIAVLTAAIPLGILWLLSLLILALKGRVTGVTEKVIDVLAWPVLIFLWFAVPVGILSLLFHFRPWIGACVFCLLIAFRWNYCVALKNAIGIKCKQESKGNEEAHTNEPPLDQPGTLTEEIAMQIGSASGIVIGLAACDVFWTSMRDAAFPAALYPGGPRSLASLAMFGVCWCFTIVVTFLFGFGMQFVSGTETTFTSRSGVPRPWSVGGYQFLITMLISPILWLVSGFFPLFWLLLIAFLGGSFAKCPRCQNALTTFASRVVARLSRSAEKQLHEVSDFGTESEVQPASPVDSNRATEEETLKLYRELRQQMSFVVIAGFCVGFSLEMASELISAFTANTSLSIRIMSGAIEGTITGLCLAGYLALCRACVRGFRQKGVASGWLKRTAISVGPIAGMLVVVILAIHSAVADVPIVWRRHVDPIKATLESLSTVITAPALPIMLTLVAVLLVMLVVVVVLSVVLFAMRFIAPLMRSR